MYEKVRTIITFEERQAIEKYLKLGFSASSIARQLERSKNSIVWEVRRNGGREKYNAKLAQKDCDKRNEIRKEKVSYTNSKRSSEFNYKKRIENIEMQLEILSETIKEFINVRKD